jgi:hypothetical protein
MKTAVEWLIEQISKEEITFTGLRAYVKFPELIQQAKEMEKEQIIAAHKTATLEAGFEHSADDWANQYYNQTYKSI